MIQLVYASAAAEPFSTAQLNALLSRARSRNTLYKVTGMLLYHTGSFLQVLEGPEQGVETIIASIQRDKRHNNTKILARQTIERREFDQWAMGFVDTSNDVLKAPGMVDYYRGLPSMTLGSSEASRYLRFFHQGLCRQTAI